MKKIIAGMILGISLFYAVTFTSAYYDYSGPLINTHKVYLDSNDNIYKFRDGKVVCYVFEIWEGYAKGGGGSISCLKTS